MAGESKRSDSSVLEVDGLLWKPRPGARASAAEFVGARTRIIEVMDEQDWNPWNRPALDAELDTLTVIFEQWTRAEPGFRQLTDDELEDRLDAAAARSTARIEAERKAREERAPRYDDALAAARLELLEKQSVLESYLDERTAVSSLKDREKRREQLTAEVAQLRTRVGDPEEVIDQRGWLPRERREVNYQQFCTWRVALVEELIELISTRSAALKASSDRDERAKLRNEISLLVLKRDTLMEIPRPKPQEMCSECAQPANWHTWVTGAGMTLLGAGPCLAWPRWSERLKQAWRMLTAESPPASEPTPAPQPLAVIPSGLPLDEVIQRLQALRDRHPDAQVKRGSRNRWELWAQEPKHST